MIAGTEGGFAICTLNLCLGLWQAWELEARDSRPTWELGFGMLGRNPRGRIWGRLVRWEICFGGDTAQLSGGFAAVSHEGTGTELSMDGVSARGVAGVKFRMI